MNTVTLNILRNCLGLMALLAFVFAILGFPAIAKFVGILWDPYSGIGWNYLTVFSALTAALAVHGFAVALGINFLALRQRLTDLLART